MAGKAKSSLWTVDAQGMLRLHQHPGQARAWNSRKRFVVVLSGSQSGKTSWGPFWLREEMRLRGPGDYLVVTPTYPLLQKKLLPEFLRLFRETLRMGEYNSQEKIFRLSPAGQASVHGVASDTPTKVFFGHAQDPDSLESATAKAAWLDEAGQNKFKLGSWEAIQRRLTIHQGRILITTTPYCYDESMEIYTRNGWKRFGELSKDDEVLACELNGESRFEKPKEIVWERYKGPMVRMKGGRIDLLVTPNHRIGYRYGSRYRTVTAAEFVQKNYRGLVIPKTVKVRGEFPTEFVLPEIKKGHRWGEIDCPPVRIPMADWCAFMGWFLSEGTAAGCAGGKIRRGVYRVTISQIKSTMRDRIREDLRKLPFKWHEDRNGFHTQGKQLWQYLSQFGGSGKKYIPRDLLAASPDHLRILIDRMVLGDGTYRHDKYGEFAYYTSSLALAETFAEACMLAGISTHTKKWDNTDGGTISGKKVNGARPIYHVCERRRQGGIITEHEEIEYDGHVGCVTVSTGFVLIRRNGEECICGNSLGWLKQRLYDPWNDARKAGQSHPDIDVIRFDSTENPAFPQEEFDRLRREMPSWKFDMFMRGIFTRMAGLIYDCFDAKRHTWPAYTRIPPEWDRRLGLDFGALNAAGVFLAEERGADRQPTGRWIAYREHRPGQRLTPEEHAATLLVGEPRTPAAWGGSRSEDDWRDRFRKAGIPVREPEIAAVEAGIDAVYSLIKQDRLIVLDSCAGLLDELASYSRELDEQGEPTEVIEDKASYHLLDSLRSVASSIPRDNLGAFDPYSEASRLQAARAPEGVWQTGDSLPGVGYGEAGTRERFWPR